MESRSWHLNAITGKNVVTLEEELEKLKDLPPLPKKEQEIIAIIATAMVDRALEDLALGRHHIPVKRKK